MRGLTSFIGIEVESETSNSKHRWHNAELRILRTLHKHSFFRLTSKMSHDHSRHDSCELRLYSRWIHSIVLSLARGMTAVVVGSGALLALFGIGIMISELPRDVVGCCFGERLIPGVKALAPVIYP